MSKFSCPLCGCNKYILIKEIDVQDIINNYSESFNYDVTCFFSDESIKIYQCTTCLLKTHSSGLPADSSFYEHMSQYPWYYEQDKKEFSYAISKMLEKKPREVLEIGAGEGAFLKKIQNAYNVYAREYNERAIEKLEKLGIPLDEGNKKYDFILMFQLLEHIENPYEFLKSVVVQIKEEGYLFITVPNNDSKYFQEMFNILDYPPHHMTQWNKSSLEKIGDIFNLKVIEYYVEPIRIEHYAALIDSRRRKIPLRAEFEGEKGIEYRKLVSSIDRVLAPYYIDQFREPGHTHGMLFQKK